MTKMRIEVAVLSGLLTAAGLARAEDTAAEADPFEEAPEPFDLPPPPPPSPFDRGSIRLGVGLGWASATDTDWFVLGVGGGYFVLNGLELGLDTTFWLGGDPFIATLTPGVRYVFHFVPTVKPYVGTFYRRYFISDGLEDSDSLGARGGLYFTINPRAYIGGGVIYEHFLDEHLYLDRDQFYPEITLAIAF